MPSLEKAMAIVNGKSMLVIIHGAVSSVFLSKYSVCLCYLYCGFL